MEINVQNRVNFGPTSTSSEAKPTTSDRLAFLPLMIGVTGDRDLREEDHEALEARVVEIFQTLQACYAQTSLVVLSPLADGTDTLVAQVAVNRGIRLVAPLPMEREDSWTSPNPTVSFRAHWHRS